MKSLASIELSIAFPFYISQHEKHNNKAIKRQAGFVCIPAKLLTPHLLYKNRLNWDCLQIASLENHRSATRTKLA